MDGLDKEAGNHEDSFYFRAKQDLLLKLLPKKKKQRILSVGVGTGEELVTMNKFGDVYAVDKDIEVIEGLPRTSCFEARLCNAEALTYPDKFFDAAVCLDTLEHVEEDGDAAREMWRTLKDGGTLIFTVPCHPFLFSAHDAALKHKRRYTEKRLRKVLRNFKEVRMSYWNASLFVPVTARRLLSRGGEPKVDSQAIPGFLDTAFFGLLKAENWLIGKGVSIPFGVTIIGVAKK